MCTCPTLKSSIEGSVTTYENITRPTQADWNTMSTGIMDACYAQLDISGTPPSPPDEK